MTKEELMNAIAGLPAEIQVYKIDDYAQTLTTRTAALCLAL